MAVMLTFNISAIEKKVKTDDPKHYVLMWVNSAHKVVLLINKGDSFKSLKYQLQILDKKGEAVFFQDFNSKKPIYVGYNMSQMPEGVYTFAVLYKYKTIYTLKVRISMPHKTEVKEEEPLIVEMISEND